MVALPLQIRLQGGGEVLVWAGVIKDEKVCIKKTVNFILANAPSQALKMKE